MTIVGEPTASPATATPTSVRQQANPMYVTMFLALSAGLLEAGILFFRHDVLNQFVWAGREVMWMAPISYLICLLPVGVLFMLPPLRRHAAAGPALMLLLGVLITLLLLDVAFGERLHLIARALLAIGVGVQAAR